MNNKKPLGLVYVTQADERRVFDRTLGMDWRDLGQVGTKWPREE